MTTIMQPFQCDLQPQIQETKRTTHTGTTTRCRTQTRNQLRSERPQPDPPHTGGTFQRRLQPLYTKNTRFRAPASSPTQAPCNIHAAITMHFAASCSKPASLYAHGNTSWQQLCSHSNAICNHRFKTRKELRTQEQPLVAEHKGGTHCARNDPSRTRRTQEVPFIAGCSHFTQKNTRFRSPASSPSQVSHHSLTPHFIECILMWCKVSHRPSLSVFLCDVKSHTTVSHHPSLSVFLCDVKSHTTVSHHTLLSVFLCDVKSRTALHWVYCYVMSSLTPQSHTTVSHHPSLSVLLQVKVIRNSEDCFPTSFDIFHHPAIGVPPWLWKPPMVRRNPSRPPRFQSAVWGLLSWDLLADWLRRQCPPKDDS